MLIEADREVDLFLYSEKIDNLDYLLEYYDSKNDYDGIINTITKYRDPEILIYEYKYIFQFIPKEVILMWKKFKKLDPLKLVSELPYHQVI